MKEELHIDEFDDFAPTEQQLSRKYIEAVEREVYGSIEMMKHDLYKEV